MRKIIHVDMDCFYAAIEIRDNPSLADKPVAVGGSASQRGVICTSNYIARQYGVRSAMATATALRQCKDLVLLPVDMPKYKAVAQRIKRIFLEHTDLVEPLAFDEAYLDVSDSQHCHGSATWIAEEIRKKILTTEGLTASAGVAPNKFLAKIASGWRKPNGLFVIRPQDVEQFVYSLPVKTLFGVGKVTAEKLSQLGITTCADLQQRSFMQLTQHFGKLGQLLYDQCRGIDHRPIIANRTRKSLSVERTFPQDVQDIDASFPIIHELHERLSLRIQESAADLPIKNMFIKIKFNDFKQKTAEVMSHDINVEQFLSLLKRSFEQEPRPFRLVGLGVHFQHQEQSNKTFIQQSLF